MISATAGTMLSCHMGPLRVLQPREVISARLSNRKRSLGQKHMSLMADVEDASATYSYLLNIV